MGADPTVRELAAAAAESVRALNHATRAGECQVKVPADLDDVLGSLASMAGRLPQLLAQLDAAAANLGASGRLAADDGKPAAGLVSGIGMNLHYAEDAVRYPAARLREAQNAASHLILEGDEPAKVIHRTDWV